MAGIGEITPGAASSPAQEQEVERLIAELRARGIAYLSGGHAAPIRARVAQAPLEPALLLRRLAECQESRVRNAIIGLLLRHPELAAALPAAIEGATPEAAEQIITLALAALYLQRLWRTRLALAFGSQPWLPAQKWARFWKARSLPHPALCQGEAGLRALEAAEQRRRGLPFTFLGDWQQQLEQLLAHEPMLEDNKLPLAESPLYEVEEEEPSMSMRPLVDREKIDRFLKRLDAVAHQPGRIFLTEGAVLVHEGLRGRTLDVDLVVETEDPSSEQTLLLAIRKLKYELQINVELSAPGDFIPLPAGWHERSHWVGRYGQLDVFYFDFYSLALSKISRANERDIQDVVLLYQRGLITLDALDAAYQEIRPQVGMGRYFNIDPARFDAHYALVRQRLADIL